MIMRHVSSDVQAGLTLQEEAENINYSLGSSDKAAGVQPFTTVKITSYGL